MKLPFTFRGTMAASTRTDWLRVPPQAKRMSIDIGWPATGTPVGTLSIEVANNRDAATGIVYPTTITTNPAGTADGTILDTIETACDYIAIVYTRTSGGTGASFTDSTGVAGTLPTLVVKE